MMPSKTLASQEEAAAPGYKKNKERISILACSNASGTHKLPLMCIGKSAKPRAIKHIKPEALPVYYANQKSAWMSRDLFKKWFFDQFVPKVERFLKKMVFLEKRFCYSTTPHRTQMSLFSEVKISSSNFFRQM